jgi:hypothetical protein
MCLQESLSAAFFQAGFARKDVHIHAREVQNYKRELHMARRWIQGDFVLAPPQVGTKQVRPRATFGHDLPHVCRLSPSVMHAQMPNVT